MKVLVVDDDATVLKQLGACLTKAKDPSNTTYEVSLANGHTDALQLLQSAQFDAVITDMVMGISEKDGLCLLMSLTQKSPVTIVLTAHPSIRGCVEAMRAGAWDYLEKNPGDGSDAYENLLASLTDAYKFRSKRRETAWATADATWVQDNLSQLISQYPGSVIAVLDRQVVGNAKSYTELAKSIEGRFPLARPTIVSIPDTSIQAIE